MEVSVLVDKIFSIIRGEVEVHAREGWVNRLVWGVQEVEYLARELRIRVLNIRRYAPHRVADGIAGAAIRRPRIVIRPGFGCDLRLSTIRRMKYIVVEGLMRTSLEHLRPIEARLLVPVRSTIHGHSVLTRGHTVARHLLVVHGVRHISTIGLRGSHAGGHVIPVLVGAAGTREMALVTSHVIHAVRDGNHAKGMNHALSRHVVQAIEVVQVGLVAEANGLLSLSILFNVSLRVGQVASSCGVSTANGALLEVALQNVTSRKRITAKHAHVGAITSI